MLTIGIDESGRFEKVDYYKKFIGGFIFTGNYEEEKNNLENFFINQCGMMGISYPEGIHSTNMRNKISMKRKETIERNLINYIKEKNKGESGKYYFVCMLKSKKCRMDYRNLSNIIDDNIASNLYEHMVCQLINNLLMHAINFSKVNDINLEIATRVAVVSSDDLEKIKEYERLGYSKNEIKGKAIFRLTDQKTFKAAISTKMMDSGIKDNLKFKLNVESTNYKEYGATTPYLYLADFICDIVRDCFDVEKPDFDIKNSFKKLKYDTGNKFLCWVYDDLDGIYNKALQNFYKKDLIKCLDYMYEARESKSEYKNYYIENWIEDIESKLKSIFDVNKMDIFIEEIEYLFSKNMADYEKGIYFIEKISDLLDSTDKKLKKENRYRYKLCDMYLRAYNHRGDVENSQKYFKKCEKYKDAVDIEEYMATINRIVEIDANCFNFKGAAQKLENSMMALDLWKEAKEESAELMGLGKQKSACLVLRGKALSSLGQFYSFMGDKEKALSYFKQALDEFKDHEEQIKVTVSYIMHLALEFNDFKLYKQYEKGFFCSEDLNEQFEILIKREGSSKDYDFYVYMKALNTFYCNDIDEKLLVKIQSADYYRANFRVNSHPWELIYKHMAELQYKNKNINEAENLMKKAFSTVNKANITIKFINSAGKIKYAVLKNCSTEIILKLIKDFKNLEFNVEMKKYFEDSIEGIEKVLQAKEPKKDEVIKAAEDITGHFTYMYC